MAKKKVKSKAKSAAKPSTSSVSDVITDIINSEVIAAAYSSANQPLFGKLCRLCESKDGPFLNIFDADKIIAKKIEELMPFGIAENDDLPHKICFRCSAKVEELYEFIQKCIKTQENLRIVLGNTKQPITKTKTRALWEEKLTKSNISNDDICDALIKKAMEGIKDIPLKLSPQDEERPIHIAPFKRITKTNDESIEKEVKNQVPVKKYNDLGTNEKVEIEVPQMPRKTRSSKIDVANLNTSNTVKTYAGNSAGLSTKNSTNSNISDTNDEKQTAPTKQKDNFLINKLSFDVEDPNDISNKESEKEEPKQEAEKQFNIMDHVSMIKVTGVGILFQCRLCNRNFVKKEVVESHNCAKHGVPKPDFKKIIPTPEPPKVSTVKYIKMDTSLKRTITENKSKPDSNKGQTSVDESHQNEPIKLTPVVKSKPKIGPASKIKKCNDANTETSQKDTISNSQESNTSNLATPSVLFPALPCLNGRYKLVPGPNNTFTLIEEKDTSQKEPVAVEEKVTSKRKLSDEAVKTSEVQAHPISNNKSKADGVDGQQKPYPVGLFQTVPHHSRLYNPPEPEPATFTNPVMKKQSYTVVQTGNPSKLLISTKPQPPIEEVPKKRSKKSKPHASNSPPKEPFTVTLEDVAPPKDSGFFTFINVDPLLQPSYVLPTHNIIQESQISTSTSTVSKAVDNKDKDRYSCNMCGETFSREKKLLSHIQSHYAKMDEEDQIRLEKVTKKKGKKQ